MTRRIVIAGAGGFGRGVYGWIMESARHRAEHSITEIVFIDDNENLSVIPQAPIISKIRDYKPQPGDEVLCAIGVPSIRKQVVQKLQLVGAEFHTFVDDRAVLGSRSKIGEGTVICPGVVVSADAVIGNQVHINFNCSIGHDTTLGNFTTLSPAVNIMGEVEVGDGAFFGGNASVLPRLSIASEIIVGAGAVLINKIEETGVTVVGNPGRISKRKGFDNDDV